MTAAVDPMQQWPLQTAIGRGGANMIAAAFNAPLIGVRARWPHVLHAVTMEEVMHAWPRVGVRRPLPRAACGVAGVRLYGRPGEMGLWPPRVAGLAPLQRCRACHEATGRKRPRSAFSVQERTEET